MSQLAITLKNKGYQVSGSDDEIFDPAKSNLQKNGILPDSFGWDESKITNELDAIILGMHAKTDNPELLKAQELNIPIYSYPEFIYENAKDKKRIVIAGSHGKTTITAMVMHVLSKQNINFDYLVGAQLEGFESQVKLTEENDIIIIEGDEYLSSPIHRVPKIHYYQPAITSISGIAWDHINVFPTEDNYVQQFRNYINEMDENAIIIYNESDEILKQVVSNQNKGQKLIPYTTPNFQVEDGQIILNKNESKTALNIIGSHNVQNLEAARLLCEQIGIGENVFLESIKDFKGASRRLQLWHKSNSNSIYYDFAHAPSKVTASVKAVKELWPNRKLIAIFELHTYSSLNQEFIVEYAHSLNPADEAIVYFNEHTLAIKKLPDLSAETVEDAFKHNNLSVITNKEKLERTLKNIQLENANLLIMTSGNLSGIKMDDIVTFTT